MVPYYLQTRYYDPNLGRFLNADAYTSTGQGILGNNMFAYCRNSPVIRSDIGGNYDEDILDADGNPATKDDLRGSASTGYQSGVQSGNGGNGQYRAPAGGGGGSNAYVVNGINVDFGHGGRHMDGNINIAELEKAIAYDVVNRPPSYGHATSVYDFIYDGRPLFYSYFTRDETRINVGTYYFMKQLQ